jgi:hypothetical protein
MTSREIKLLWVNSAQLLNMLKSLNINKDAMLTHESTLKVVQDKLDKYQKILSNQDYVKTLSPPERKCIHENASVMHQTFQDLNRELNRLNNTRHSGYVIRSISELESAYLLLNWYLENSPEGALIVPRFSAVNPKTFEGGTYQNKIYALFTEIETTAFDMYGDEDYNDSFLGGIRNHFILVTEWLRKENERLKTEGLPEPHVIKIPEEKKPEIPKAPPTIEEVRAANK